MQPPSEPNTDSLEPGEQAASLPDPMATTGSLEPAKVGALLAGLDLNDSHSVLFFGSAAQEQLTSVSDSMLERVRTKDVGPAGEALNDMVLTLRGYPRDTDAKWPEARRHAARLARKMGMTYGKFLGK